MPLKEDENEAGAGVRFRTTLRQAEGKNATGFLVSADVLAQLDKGQRPPVRVTINGYDYRTTVGVMGGQAMIGVSAAIRKETGLEPDDEVEVRLVVDDSPRKVSMPPDFAEALERAGVRGFFDGLANSLQRYHVGLVEGAKAAETRQRRIEKAVALFEQGKKR